MYINTPLKNFEQDKNSEIPFRSVLKSFSWRAIGTIDTVLISWLITDQIDLALSIGSIELFSKMILYFLHERIWDKVKWGRQKIN